MGKNLGKGDPSLFPKIVGLFPINILPKKETVGRIKKSLVEIYDMIKISRNIEE